MKLHPEDPRLTAWLLGELPAEDAAAVERAVAGDPALQAAMQELETIQRLLTDTLAPGNRTLLPSQRENVRRAAKEVKKPRIASSNANRRRWLVPLAAAAAIILAAVVFIPKNQTRKPSASIAPKESPAVELERTRMKLMPAPGPADAGIAATSKDNSKANADLPELRARNYVAAADFPTLDLPVQSGKSSLEWIRRAVLTNHQLPHHDEVRLEEILNSFSLRPAGLTVIARNPAPNWHPDNRDSGKTVHAATIATESLACPWKPSATLVLISIRGNPYTDSEIKAVFRANPANISRYRLLGFSSVEGRDNGPLPTTLPAKSSTTLVLEIEPSSIAGELGAIEWSVNGQHAAPVVLNRHGDTEPSDDARFAALVCTYAQWLVGEQNGMIDTELLAAIARETASESLSGDRIDFLNLIDRSMQLR